MTKESDSNDGSISLLSNGWVRFGIIACIAVFAIACITVAAVAWNVLDFQSVFAQEDPVAMTMSDALGDPADEPAVSQPVTNETEMEVSEPAAAAVQSEAPAQTADTAPATTGQGDDNSGGYSGLTPPFIPEGGKVDTSNPIPLPPGLPADFPTMSLDAQTQAMSSLLDLPLISVQGEEGVAWNWDGKGVVNREVTCPSWIICHVTLVDGNATVLFRGHGLERDVISAGTFRVERQIEGRGGLCFNSWMAQVYEASIVNILHILGEAEQCPYLPAQLEARINPALGERLREVMSLTGAEGVISIGTVKDGFGAFVIVQTGGPETLESFTCFAGAACAVDTGDGWQWVNGPVDVENAQGAVLYDLTKFANECEAFTGAQGALGTISNGPSCSQ